ncbi:hypothetical protein DL765_004162 [Monosporascus sp. GIB2]|nr:hypothetical protein DL765_004162 [Monosporascus sp. GIB2]
MADKVTPISIKGRYLWKGEDRFVINGVVYQPYKPSREGAFSIPDPLAEDQLEDLEKSIPLFKELGINTLFVFFTNPAENHDEAMNMLAEAGIYVLTCLSTPHRTIRRNAPFESYTADLLQAYFQAIDCMAAYRNTLGVIVADKVINWIPATVAAPVIRAVTRDVKRYMALAAEVAGQRVLPVGISCADVSCILEPQFAYFSAGREEEVIDIFAFNCYLWAGNASMQISGYDILVKKFKDTHIPVFFSEYGANTCSPRLFQETRAILSREMTDTFSGGITYKFFDGPNRFGLVQKQADGTLDRLADFKNLKESVQACKDVRHNTLLEATTGAERRKLEMPAQSHSWKAEQTLPDCPLDWDKVREQIEDGQWVDVERDLLDLEVEDLAASVWERFRTDVHELLGLSLGT